MRISASTEILVSNPVQPIPLCLDYYNTAHGLYVVQLKLVEAVELGTTYQYTYRQGLFPSAMVAKLITTSFAPLTYVGEIFKAPFNCSRCNVYV